MSTDSIPSTPSSAVYYAAPNLLAQSGDPFEHALAEICTNAGIKFKSCSHDLSRISLQSLADGERVVIAYPSLQQSIELALAENASVDKTSADWVSLGNALLKLFRENRSNISLIEVSGLKIDANKWLPVFLSTLGFKHPAPRPQLSIDDPTPALFALQFLFCKQKIPQARTLMRELEACSIPAPSNFRANEEPDLAPVITYLGEQRENQNLRREFNALQEAHQTLAQKYTKLEIAHDKQNAVVSKLENSLRVIRESNSWRITAPIRVFLIALRRLFT